MENFALIFLCLGVGFALRKLPRFPTTTPHVLNQFVIYFSYPALVLVQLPALLRAQAITIGWLTPVSMAWILFVLSALLFWNLGKHLKWSKPVIGALIICAGTSNTSFVGFPLLTALIGPEALKIGVILDQLGSFLVLSTLGIIAGTIISGGKITFGRIFKSVLFFPPFTSLLLAVLWHLSGTDDNPFIIHVLEKIAATLVPLAMVAVGFQLKFNVKLIGARWKPLISGLVFKLYLIPAFFLILYVFIFQDRGFSSHVTVLESAMAPMITSAVVAAEFGFDAELANLFLGSGILLSLFTVPLWNFLMSGLFTA